MSPAPPYEDELFTHPTEISSTVVVNDRVCIQTEEDQRVISVHGFVFSHYSIKDRTAEASPWFCFLSRIRRSERYRTLFRLLARSLRRYQERSGLVGWVLLRAAGEGLPGTRNPEARPNHSPPETKGMSNRWIAGRLGSAKRLSGKVFVGWLKSDPDPEPNLPLPDSQAKRATVTVSSVIEIHLPLRNSFHAKVAISNRFGHEKSRCNPARSVHGSPLGRHGLLDDALPVFASARSLPRAVCCWLFQRSCQWPAFDGRENLR